jgi:predicted outer membrane repeat protein
MKKYFDILKTAAALGLLLFAGCINPLAPPPDQGNGPAGGKGLVRIETGAGAARTAVPEAVFYRYEYLFSKGGGADEPGTPSGDGTFELDPGDWRVTVKAFMGDGQDTLAAQGSENFNITGGAETKVTVKLLPVTGEGTGTLHYTLRYPATPLPAATVKAFTLTLLADSTDADLVAGVNPVPNPLEGTITTIPSGYYLARASLEKGGIPAEKIEVVHIYQNMTTNLELEFFDGDFRAFVVLSGADGGPGTLRQALTDALAATGTTRTILIDLPEDARTITLTSGPLPEINKNLVIMGNGAILTQSGIKSGANTQLLRIAAGISVSIHRLRFKGARASGNGGAIYNAGTLTLESCIFNDNQTTGNGGAVYTAGNLTVSASTFYGNSAGTAAGQGGAVYRAGGTASLTGNIFWGNTAAAYPVVGSSSGSPASNGFNVSDKDAAGSGWTFDSTDKTAASLPVSPVSFRPIAGGQALNVIGASPAGYPETDFYGVPIPAEDAAAGAVQTATQTAGFVLDYAPVGPGTVTVPGEAVDAEGFAGNSVTLTAAPLANGEFRHWIVDGVRDSEQTNTLTVTMNAHKTVRAVFYTKVTGTGNTGAGSLREALDNADDGSGIILPAGQTITLNSTLPEITRSLVIEGNGATLTQSGFTEGTASQLLRITAAAEVRVSRLHFKGGRAAGNANGAAINNAGKLTLESCIFSDNRITGGYGYGGAVSNSGSLTVSGCTFYGNNTGTAGGQGGAIHQTGTSAVLTLTGNVFWGNTAGQNPVLYLPQGTVTSRGFNVSDKAGGTDTTLDSGWTFEPTDKTAASLPVTSASFKPMGGGAAAGVFTSGLPAGYPVTDFYGVSIPGTGAAAGAVQTATAPGLYFLDYAPIGPGGVSASGTFDSDGLTGGDVTLTAANGEFRYWIVDGARDSEQSNTLTVTMNAHKTVRAVFYTRVNNTDSEAGSLREALDNADDGSGIILPEGQTITLTTPLPAIGVNLVIEGNGATLTQSGFTPGYETQLLRITGTAEVRISRVHFKGGRATIQGGAIYTESYTNLTLESCVFSGNQATGDSSNGGAIYASGNLTVSGCTFYGNSAGKLGGAIYRNGTTRSLTLTGNVFWGNTAPASPVLYTSNANNFTSGGFNISDKADGTDTTLGSGWTFVNGDKTPSSQPISSVSFKPIGGLGANGVEGVITARPAGYPEKDFYGVDVPETGAAAGAVQTAAAGSGFILDYAPVGPGTVAVTGGVVDEDGLTSGSVTLTATALANGIFGYWIEDGQALDEQPPANELTVNVSAYKTVRAVFHKLTNTLDSGPGSLRETLAGVEVGDVIFLPEGGTITLSTTPLPDITRSIVIEGNGATLTQNGFTPGEASQLLRISYNYIDPAPVVRISRLHFKGARVTDSAAKGGAIYNNRGILTLESCIFSDNQVGSTGAVQGGAIYNTGNGSSLTVSGCTFYGNIVTGSSSASGGAIYTNGGSLTLTGNIFQENTASRSSVIGGNTGITSKGYNVSDKATGTDNTTGSGWTFVTGDKTLADITFDAGFRPSSASNGLPVFDAASLTGFPALYFDGTSRGASSAPGAMPAQQGN